MSTQDYRIRFNSALINFADDVGVTGQDHDSYPSPGQQPRYDWMRMFLIGLLSCQASTDEPTQFRDGTPWFDLNTGVMKVRYNDAWVSFAEVIQVDTDADGAAITLADIYTTLRSLIGFKPTASFSGSSSTDGVESITIPTTLQAAAGSGSRPFVWIDGVLVDPRNCAYASGTSPTSIVLTGGVTIDAGQTFTVMMLGIESSFFSLTEVVL